WNIVFMLRRSPISTLFPYTTLFRSFQAFGAFYTERIGYDRQYGMTDNQHYRLINRFNIWERSHYYDDPENMIGPVECFTTPGVRSEEHTSELQSRENLVCRLLLEKK